MKIYRDKIPNEKDSISLIFVFLVILTLLLSYRLYQSSYNGQALGDSAGIIINHPYLKDGKQIIQFHGFYLRNGRYPEYKTGQYIVFSTKSDERYLDYPDIEVIPEAEDSFLVAIAGFRRLVVSRIKRVLSEPSSSLVLGMTIGYKPDFPEKFYETLRRGGVLHIIVVSGFNVSLILGMFAVFLPILGPRRYFYFSGAFVIFFSLIAGLDPPVIRASIIGVIGIYGHINGKYKSAFYHLFLTGLLMNIVDPTQIYSISFQLSFMATLGVLISGELTAGFGALVREITTVLSVNIILFPILSYYFGQVSLISIPVNLLILWVVPIVTILGYMAAIVNFIPLSAIITALISYITMIIEFFDSLGFGYYEYQISLKDLVIYYVALAIFVRILYRFKGQ